MVRSGTRARTTRRERAVGRRPTRYGRHGDEVLRIGPPSSTVNRRCDDDRRHPCGKPRVDTWRAAIDNYSSVYWGADTSPGGVIGMGLPRMQSPTDQSLSVRDSLSDVAGRVGFAGTDGSVHHVDALDLADGDAVTLRLSRAPHRTTGMCHCHGFGLRLSVSPRTSLTWSGTARAR